MKRVILFMIMMLSIFAAAQTTGKIKGKVTDIQNNPLQGAQISVTGTLWGAESDTEGNYLIIGVGSGNYTVKCEMTGYVTVEINDIKIRSGQTIIQDFKLKVQSIDLGKIDAEAKKLLLQYQREANAEGLNQAKLFMMLKKELAKKKGFIL